MPNFKIDSAQSLSSYQALTAAGDAPRQPDVTEKLLLAAVAEQADGRSFEDLHALQDWDIGRDALRDAVMACLEQDWLFGTFESLHCSDAGRAFLDKDESDAAGEQHALWYSNAGADTISIVSSTTPLQGILKGVGSEDGSTSEPDSLADDVTPLLSKKRVQWPDMPSASRTDSTKNVVLERIYEIEKRTTTEVGKNSSEVRTGSTKTPTSSPPVQDDLDFEKFCQEMFEELQKSVTRELNRIAGVDFGEPPMGPERTDAVVEPSQRLTQSLRKLVVTLRCLISPSYRKSRAVSRQMGAMLGVLAGAINDFPLAGLNKVSRVPVWYGIPLPPPVSTAHGLFIDVDTTALTTHVRAMLAKGIPENIIDDHRAPMNLYEPALRRHIGRLKEAHLREVRRGLKAEWERIQPQLERLRAAKAQTEKLEWEKELQQAYPHEYGTSLLRTETSAHAIDGRKAMQVARSTPGHVFRYANLLAVVENLVEMRLPGPRRGPGFQTPVLSDQASGRVSPAAV